MKKKKWKETPYLVCLGDNKRDKERPCFEPYGYMDDGKYKDFDKCPECGSETAVDPIQGKLYYTRLDTDLVAAHFNIGYRKARGVVKLAEKEMMEEALERARAWSDLAKNAFEKGLLDDTPGDRIRELRDKGRTYDEIAKELHISKSTISRELKGIK